jgi:type I restriction enzyme, S subunit
VAEPRTVVITRSLWGAVRVGVPKEVKQAHLGVFSLAEYAGVISPDYTVLRASDPNGVKYFEFVLRSPACRFELRVRAKGIVEGFWRLYTQ